MLFKLSESNTPNPSSIAKKFGLGRFDTFIKQLENIEKQLKTIAVQYNEQRMNKLKTIFTKIRNYEN